MGSPVPAPSRHYCLASPRHKKIPNKKMADTVELQEAFKLFDMDGDGMITKDELRKLVEKVGGKMTEGEAKGLIHQADKDGNESIDFSEFSKLDSDNSGYITKDEMTSVITDCDHFSGDKMEEAKKCIAELDVDKDGRVSYPEFLLVWKYKSS